LEIQRARRWRTYGWSPATDSRCGKRITRGRFCPKPNAEVKTIEKSLGRQDSSSMDNKNKTCVEKERVHRRSRYRHDNSLADTDIPKRNSIAEGDVETIKMR